MDSTYHIQKALDYIEAHLKQKLQLVELADLANFSPWHFHRVFFALTGITVGEYVRRRRMSEASRELVFSAKSIKLIAAEYQFKSQEAFTRTFKSCCGITPGIVRKHIAPMMSYQPIHLCKNTSTKGVKMIQPRMKSKAAFTVLGMTCKTTMQKNIIPQLWGDFNSRCKELKHIVLPDTCFGICMSEPNVEMTENTPFIYLAGMEVSKVENLPEGMTVKQIPAADYAVFEHHGSLDTLHDTYDAIYSGWFSESEYTQQGDYDFELYDERFEFGSADSIMEIWVPIKKKSRDI